MHAPCVADADTGSPTSTLTTTCAAAIDVAASPAQVLAKAGVPTFSMNSGLTTEDFGWGSKNFHKMVRAEVAALSHNSSHGVRAWGNSPSTWAGCSCAAEDVFSVT